MLRATSLIAIIAIAFTVGPVGQAAADPEDSAEIQTADSVAADSAYLALPAVPSAALLGNVRDVTSPSEEVAPLPCYGYSYSPRHDLGWVAALSATSCDVHSTDLTVDTTLYRSRWYGLEELDQREAIGSGYYVDDQTGWKCAGKGKYTYYNRSFHTAVVGGTYGTANTSAKAKFWC